MLELTLSRSAGAARTDRGASLFTRILQAAELRKQRRALAGLSDELLDDIGVARQDAQSQAARPVWNAPVHWTK